MNIREPLYGAAAERVREQLAAEDLSGRVVTFTPAASILPTDGAREHTDIDDEPIDMGKLAALANEPWRPVVSDAWDAIEALFRASHNPEMTRQALHEFVDMTAAETVAGGVR